MYVNVALKNRVIYIQTKLMNVRLRKYFEKTQKLIMRRGRHFEILGIIWTIMMLPIISSAFPMDCKNMNSQIDIVKGYPFDFHCTSTRKFHSCVLERTGTDLKSVRCTFIMYTPSSFFGAGGQTELQRAGYDCDLDIESPYRIQIIEKHNQMQCHLRINSSDFMGKNVSKYLLE